jgi:hypothetical protein
VSFESSPEQTCTIAPQLEGLQRKFFRSGRRFVDVCGSFTSEGLSTNACNLSIADGYRNKIFRFRGSVQTEMDGLKNGTPGGARDFDDCFTCE